MYIHLKEAYDEPMRIPIQAISSLRIASIAHTEVRPIHNALQSQWVDLYRKKETQSEVRTDGGTAAGTRPIVTMKELW